MSALTNVRLNEPWQTAQTEKADDRQIKNAAGGYTFEVDDAARFRRFLTIGTDGGTYYASEQELTKSSVKFVQKHIDKHGLDAVREIVNVSSNALAPKNTQAIFALVLALDSDNQEVKAAAKSAVNKVVRTSTHLFEFMQFIKNNSGFGRAKTSAVANWYLDKSADQVAYQSVKYRQRNGWTHRDILRLSHPKNLNHDVAEFILHGKINDSAPEIIQTFGRLQAVKSEREALEVLKSDPNAPWELLPTEYLNSAAVWRQLFESGIGQTALLRNTKRLHNLGMFNDMVFARQYADQLSNRELIHKGRIHPIQYLNAYVAYKGEPAGVDSYWGGTNGVNQPNSTIADALNDGYELAFKNVEPANKRTLIGLDVSGSMAAPANGLNISCAVLGAAMSQLIMRKEPYSMIRGFSHQFVDLGIGSRDSLHDVIQKTTRMNFGATDCSLPMDWALKNKVAVDTFMIFTDSETWHGNEHSHEALERYRQRSGIDARFVCVAASGTNNTVADPNDAGSMDVSGFDSSAPKLITDFSAGRI